jgi:hypothetical protein
MSYPKNVQEYGSMAEGSSLFLIERPDANERGRIKL